MKRMRKRSNRNITSSAEGESDPILEGTIRDGVPLTRENYLDRIYAPDEIPDPMPAELEAMISHVIQFGGKKTTYRRRAARSAQQWLIRDVHRWHAEWQSLIGPASRPMMREPSNDQVYDEAFCRFMNQVDRVLSQVAAANGLPRTSSFAMRAVSCTIEHGRPFAASLATTGKHQEISHGDERRGCVACQNKLLSEWPVEHADAFLDLRRRGAKVFSRTCVCNPNFRALFISARSTTANRIDLLHACTPCMTDVRPSAMAQSGEKIRDVRIAINRALQSRTLYGPVHLRLDHATPRDCNHTRQRNDRRESFVHFLLFAIERKNDVEGATSWRHQSFDEHIFAPQATAILVNGPQERLVHLVLMEDSIGRQS